MSARTRNKEAQIRFSVDGQDLEGSFLKVTDWDVAPGGEIVETEFTGEDRPDLDTSYKTHKGTFTIQELSADVERLLQSLDDKDRAHQPMPEVAMTVYKLYRQPGAGDSTALYTGCALVCTSMSGSGHSYLNSKWSWAAPNRKTL